MPNEKGKALYFIFLLGMVSFFADMTYEGARSIAGPYLLELGAGAAIVGAVSGLGEFVGYGLRLISGYLCHKTGRPWIYANVGYAINLLAVPLLSFCGSWVSAASLLVTERFGKAIRIPARDAMISYASHHVGRGFGFGLHGFFDQLGAVLGPLLVAAILYAGGSLKGSFLWLGVPAVCSFIALGYAQKKFRQPEDLEVQDPTTLNAPFPKAFWICVAGFSCIGCGYVDFALISYHFQKIHLVSVDILPLFYSLAMMVVAFSSPFLGKLYDKYGLKVVIAGFFIASFSTFFAFFGQVEGAVFGMILWGVGYAFQASIVPALVARIVPATQRAAAFGVLYSIFGLSWFLGSSLMGILYDHSILSLTLFSFVFQLIGITALGTQLKPLR